MEAARARPIAIVLVVVAACNVATTWMALSYVVASAVSVLYYGYSILG